MHQKNRKLCNKVPKQSTHEIRTIAHQVRNKLVHHKRFGQIILPIAELLDYLRDKGEIEFILVEDYELKSEYAVSLPNGNSATNKPIIKCRESVYHAALNGSPRDKFTLAHELGHVLLHRNTDPAFARAQTPSNHHYTEDAEWQANTFASELLVDSRQLEGVYSPRDIEQKFGISFESAGYVHYRYKQEGIL
ncbi:ImmA/IrrE family metallo-endopeptidase [Shewanella waksmanii]|uniref:ImmA/IrrE family metallo-endopeptidase n=1 Tax=Shewanella waksmanii TaxID=213783 RepID=UPI00055CCF32|nr:ImmA/IrrE family metallo-endopeptidase [Shewanella waksmanii]